ncbi:hypothetical protein KO504_04120 [Winogradskyella psychrotolerans]|uniref:hypothetical protein n=1 Tax=Winogradskyella psychrotolerans TaxID=1344585 RepID=UPI001C06C62E|nr:hypothetical protein [Winogradskyella psychrotolerans]MBU2920516.1 hypothetical protein [Winogradskyella psychrotolerans]
MKTTYELTYKPLIKILIWLGIFLVVIIFFGDFLYELKYGRSLKNSNSLYVTGIPFTILLLLPSFLITIFYLKENYKTNFTIDRNKNIIEIKSGKNLKTYSLDQIESSIYNRQSYQKDFFWDTFSCYADLGYLDLTFKNNDRYFLSCFLIDITKEPIFENSKIKYSFLPFIDRTDPKLIMEKAEKQTTKRIEKLKSNYSSKTVTELNEMLNNKSKYQKEAIIAIKETLKNKNVG